MSDVIILVLGFGALTLGSFLGYFARQSIAKRRAGTIEAELQKRISETKSKSQLIISDANKKAAQILEELEEETAKRRQETLKTERFLRKKENTLEEKESKLDDFERQIREKVSELKAAKDSIQNLREEAEKKLEKVSGLSRDQAKKEILEAIEKNYRQEILERIKRLEKNGEERFHEKAKEMLASAIQRCSLSQAQEITTTTVNLPNEEIKGRIIGKEGRNIRRLEALTGTEIVVDETPEIAIVSGFSPLRRHIAKLVLERLIKDGRIQPSRIEEEVEKAKKEINSQIKKAGEQAMLEAGIVGFEPKLIELLGALNFRTSYGQNVLLHSIEVAHLSAGLAAELGANVSVAKRAGLLHDIGKALDHQVEGSHVDIGIKILEKLGESKEVVEAMKAHHQDYEPTSLEAIIVQVADQISGARPGARKDTLENYLQRLGNLEAIATSFPGVDNAYAIQAGRELRVFVKPEEIDDLEAHKLAKDIAKRIQEELKYPGEIKVTLIREKRIVEYAK